MASSKSLVLREVRLPVAIPQAGKRVGDIRMICDGVEVQLQTQPRGIAQHELAVLERVPASDQVVSPGNVELGERFLDQENWACSRQNAGKRPAPPARSSSGVRLECPAPGPSPQSSCRQEIPPQWARSICTTSAARSAVNR